MSEEAPPAARVGLLRDRAFVVALVIAVVVALGFGLVAPVLPLFARDFGVGLFAVTALVSTFAGVRLVSNPYTGGLTDRIGMRQAVGYGALIVAVSSLLAALAQTYWQLLVFRGFGGFGSALFFNALLSLVVRAVPQAHRGRAVGMLQGAFLFGIAVGPSVGGLLAAPLGLRGPFVVYAVFCGAAGFVALRFLPDVRAAPPPAAADPASEQGPASGPRRQTLAGTLRTARRLCQDRTFVAALVMMAASRWAATGVRFSLIPVFAIERVGLSELLLGTALTLAAVGQLALLWPAGKAADTLGRKVVGAPAYLVFAVIAATIGFATTPMAFFVVLTLYGMATGLTSVTPPAVVGDVVPPEDTGAGIGVLNTAGDLGSVLGPMVSGLLAQAAGYGWGFGVSALLLAAGGVVALRMRETLPAAGAAARA